MRFTYAVLGLGLAAAALPGCRADSGPDDYQSQESLRLDAEPPPIDADIEPGERRYNLGAFYEGPADEVMIIDGTSVHFYIYEDTFSQVTEEVDRVEGAVADRLISRGGPWWGGGIHYDQAQDLSGWATLNLSVKSADASQAGFKIAMNNPGDVQTVIDLAEYGFAADGQWHRLEIPLSDYADAGADLTRVTAPLVFAGPAGAAGDSVLIDGVFLSSL